DRLLPGRRLGDGGGPRLDRPARGTVRRADGRRRSIRPRHPELRRRPGEEDHQRDDAGHPQRAEGRRDRDEGCCRGDDRAAQPVRHNCMSMVQAPLPTVEAGDTTPASAAGGRTGSVLSWAKARPWPLLAPGLIILAVLMLWPLVQVFIYSLQDYGLRQINTGETNFIGFGNYVEALTDSTLWTVVLPNTVGFAAVAVFTTVAVGTLVALLLARLGTLWRTIVSSCIMV